MKLLSKLKGFSVKRLLDDAKYRSLTLNILGTFGIKGLALSLTLFSMPSYMRYFQNDIALGVWFSLLSVLNWIMTFDLGIGSGLRNQLVPELNAGNNDKMKRLISSAYFMLGALSLLVCIAGIIAIRFIDLNVILNIGEDVIPSDVLYKSVALVFISVILKFFLSIVTSIFYAMQKTVLPNLLTLISSVSVIAFLNIYSSTSVAEKFWVLSVFHIFSSCLPIFVATVIVFATVLRRARPSIKSVEWTTGKSVIGLGGKFFIIQICLMVITSTNEFLIGYLTSPGATVEYQVYNRWFFMIITAYSLLIQPMWSSFSQLCAEGNYKWIKTVYGKFKLFSLLGAFGAVVLSFIFQIVVNIWLGDEAIDVKLLYALCFAALITVTLFINSATCVANAMSELRCQMIWSVVGAVVKIPLAILLVYALDAWIGVLLANVISLLPLVIFQSLDTTRRLGAKVKAQNAKEASARAAE